MSRPATPTEPGEAVSRVPMMIRKRSQLDREGPYYHGTVAESAGFSPGTLRRHLHRIRHGRTR